MKDKWNRFKDSNWFVVIFFLIVLLIGFTFAYWIVFKLHLLLLVMLIFLLWLLVKFIELLF